MEIDLGIIDFEIEWVTNMSPRDNWTPDYKEGYLDGLGRAKELIEEDLEYVK